MPRFRLPVRPAFAIVSAATMMLVATDAQAQRAPTRTAEVIPVHQTLASSVSNGCDYRAEIAGEMRRGNAGVLTGDFRVGAAVTCPNGQAAHSPTRRVRATGMTPAMLAHELERAAQVTTTDGADSCAYAPHVEVAAQHFVTDSVAIACVTDEHARGGT